MTTTILTLTDPDTNVTTFWADSRDEFGRLASAEPFETLDAALAYAASL